jgi:hypothetical protein
MTRYTIKLSKTEVEELNQVINNGHHTTQAYRTALILLNCDKGEYSKDTSVKNHVPVNFLLLLHPAGDIRLQIHAIQNHLSLTNMPKLSM